MEPLKNSDTMERDAIDIDRERFTVPHTLPTLTLAFCREQVNQRRGGSLVLLRPTAAPAVHDNRLNDHNHDARRDH